MKQLLFIAALISVIACNQNKTEGKELKTPMPDPALDSARTGIEQAWAAHTVEEIKGNAIAAMKLFEDSAVFIEHGSPMLIGRTALDNFEIELFKQVKVLNATHTIEGLSLQGNIAYQLGLAKINLKANTDGSESELNAHYMATWRKQNDESWRILYFVYYP